MMPRVDRWVAAGKIGTVIVGLVTAVIAAAFVAGLVLDATLNSTSGHEFEVVANVVVAVGALVGIAGAGFGRWWGALLVAVAVPLLFAVEWETFRYSQGALVIGAIATALALAMAGAWRGRGPVTR